MLLANGCEAFDRWTSSSTVTAAGGSPTDAGFSEGNGQTLARMQRFFDTKLRAAVKAHASARMRHHEGYQPY